jgi:hypothetical protein
MATRYIVSMIEQVTHRAWVEAETEEEAYDKAAWEIQQSEDIDTIYDREFMGDFTVQEDNE